MRIIIKRLCILGGVLLALPAAHAGDNGHYYNRDNFVQETIQVADHFMFQPAPNPPTIAPGATILIRDKLTRTITATLTSAALTPDHAYSIWWVIFNKPEYCAKPYECAGTDLGNPMVKGSVFWGGGLIADSSGHGNTQISISPGKTKRELFGPLTDTGLRNMKAAEIHLVLRTHGETGVAGSVAQQIGTVDDACPADGCQNVFFSVHRAN